MYTRRTGMLISPTRQYASLPLKSEYPRQMEQIGKGYSFLSLVCFLGLQSRATIKDCLDVGNGLQLGLHNVMKEKKKNTDRYFNCNVIHDLVGLIIFAF